MPFKYACFISYQPTGSIMERFVRDLREALSVELAPMLDLEVFADSQIPAGEVLEQGVAKAICESVSMVVVFTPKYLASIHCARELQGMKRLEEQRLKALGSSIPGVERLGFIIPIVLRGADVLPEELRRRHCYNFDRFLLGDTKIYRSPGFRRSVTEMASSIYRWHEALRSLGKDPCADCTSFRLPSDEEVRSWLEDQRLRMMLPFRNAGR